MLLSSSNSFQEFLIDSLSYRALTLNIDRLQYLENRRDLVVDRFRLLLLDLLDGFLRLGELRLLARRVLKLARNV
jgi:hypothetical protein